MSNCILEIEGEDTAGMPIPRYIGPFALRSEAEAAAILIVGGGTAEWSVIQLASPRMQLAIHAPASTGSEQPAADVPALVAEVERLQGVLKQIEDEFTAPAVWVPLVNVGARYRISDLIDSGRASAATSDTSRTGGKL